MNHIHDWKPIAGWSGRYRCSECKIIGYLKFVMGEKGTVIIPYACKHKGCTRKAQVGDKYGRRFCFKHWKKKEIKAHPDFIGVRRSL